MLDSASLLEDSVIAGMGGWPSRSRLGLPSPVLNLDKSALLDRLRSDQPAERRLSVRWFAKSGVCQVGWGIYKPEKRVDRSRKTNAAKAECNRKMSAKRAATEIRRSCLAIAADRMLTLTYAENMTDRAQALRDFGAFIRICRREFPGWESVAVLEYQQRGACHFHIALSGFYDVVKLRSIWHSIIGRGSVNMAWEPRYGRGNVCSKLASYMGKYLAKEVDEGRKPGEHRYFKTECVADGRRQVFYIRFDAPLGIERRIAVEVMRELICSEEVRFPSNLWFGPEGMGSSGCASSERP